MNESQRRELRELVFQEAHGHFLGSLESLEALRNLQTIDEFQRLCESLGIEIIIKGPQV